MKKLKSLEDLFVHELQDLYSAEKQIEAELPKVIDAAEHKDLKKALQAHLKETKTQRERLDKIFADLGAKPGGHKCEGMEGLLKEGASALEIEDRNTRDAAIIGACNRVEHYEMAGYGTVRAFAEKLGKHDIADVLTQTLEEESRADEKLTTIARRHINFEAMASAG